MTKEPEPGLYDIEFESVYDIDFAVTDETALKEAVVVPIGKVAMGTEASDMGNDPYKDIPSEIVKLAEEAINTLKASGKGLVHIAEISQVAFNGQRAAKQDFRKFLKCLNMDDRLEYIGSGQYVIVGEAISKPYWPGEMPNVDRQEIEELAEYVIESMYQADYHKFTLPQILGIAKSHGGFLSADEVNELLVILANTKGIIARENGGFSLNLSEEELANRKEEKAILPVTFAEPGLALEEREPLTEKQVGKITKTIRSSPEFREMKTQAERKANPRRRGKSRRKKNKVQGRAHGKKQSIDQVIALLESTPSNIG